MMLTKDLTFFKGVNLFQRCEKYWLDALTSVRGHKWTCRKKAVLQLSYSAFFVYSLSTYKRRLWNVFFPKLFLSTSSSTVWKLQKFPLVIFLILQKFRESNGFTNEITKALIWRKIFFGNSKFFIFPHCVFLLSFRIQVKWQTCCINTLSILVMTPYFIQPYVDAIWCPTISNDDLLLKI